MLQLLDGPCQATLMVKRAPLYLRAVLNKRTGEVDVLDQLEDEPKRTETVHVYRRQGDAMVVHVSMSPRSHSGYYMMAEYRHLPGVDGEKLRDCLNWRLWVSEQLDGKVDMETGAEKL